MLTFAKAKGDDVRRIADQLEGDVRAAFVKAVKQLKGSLPLNEMTELLEAGKVKELKTLVGKMSADPSLFTTPFVATVENAGSMTAAEFSLDFAIQNPAVIKWAEKQGSRLIKDVTDQTIKTVSRYISESIKGGVAPRQQARTIQHIVGLTAQDAKSVALFQQAMIDGGSTLGAAEKSAAKMAAKRLKNRAISIARTETMAASNQGQFLAWQDAADADLFDPATTERVWIASPDNRTCPICSLLDGTTVAFKGSWTATRQVAGSGTKPIPSGPITTQTPPAHPQCRCTTGLVFND